MTTRTAPTRVLLATLAITAACKAPAPASNLKDGFVGQDCATARADLEVQDGKLPAVTTAFASAYGQYLDSQKGKVGSTGAGDSSGDAVAAATEPQSPEGAGDRFGLAESAEATIPDEFKSETDCNAKLLSGRGTAEATSAYQDVYQKCVDYFAILSKVRDRESQLKSTACQQGADATVVPVFITSCDTPCLFTNVECGYVELTAAGQKRRFACGSTRAAESAARGYCREFNVADSDCQVGQATLKRGSEIATLERQIAGNSSEAAALKLSTFDGAKASLEYKGGVVTSVEGNVKFQADGEVRLVLKNDRRPVRAGEFLNAGTTAACTVKLTGFREQGTRAFVGVGGNFSVPVLGIGVDAKAGADAGFTFNFSKSYEEEIGSVDGGGLQADVVIQRCIPLTQSWLASTGRDKIFAPLAKQLSDAVGRFKQEAAKPTGPAFDGAAVAKKVACGKVAAERGAVHLFGSSAADRARAQICATYDGGQVGFSPEGQSSCRVQCQIDTRDISEDKKVFNACVDGCWAALTNMCAGMSGQQWDTELCPN